MPSPRSLLRSKFVEWFRTVPELDRFVSDYFDGARGSIPDRGTEDRADALIAWLQRENRIADLWPALREERKERAAEIYAIEAAWKLAPVPDDATAAWLLRYQATLDKLFSDKLRGNPTWSASLDPLDLLVRERPTEGDEAPYVGRLDRVFNDVEPRCALVAEGGSGKSTIVLELGVRMVRAALESPTAPIPFFMQLNHFDSRERAFDGLLDGIAASSGLDPKSLRELWAGDRPLCFLLDGLNEVRPEYRDSCRSAIGLLTQRTHRCIVTSRPSPDVDKLVSTVGASVLEIVPLTKQQVRKVLEKHSVVAVDLDSIAELAETPFLVSAIVRIFQGDQQRKLPTTVPQLYRTLIDDFVFAKREEEAPSEVRPTTYDYEHVKRPILSELALRMRREGRTRVAEDATLRAALKAQLFALRDKYEGELDVMPEKPIAQNLLDEMVSNGVLSRDAETLEFWHESVLDYFTALGLDVLPPDDIAALVPPLVWRRVRPDAEMDLAFAFAESLVMYAGFTQRSDALQAVANRHPAIAARCFGRAGVSAPAALVDQWIAMLDHPHETRRWMASECLRLANAVDDRAGRKLVQLLVPDTALVETALAALATCKEPGPIEAFVDKLLEDDGELGLASAVYRHPMPAVVIALVRRIASATTDEASLVVGRMDPQYVRTVIRETGDPSLIEIVKNLKWRARAMPKRAVLRLEEGRLREYVQAHRASTEAVSTEDVAKLLESERETDRYLAIELLQERGELVASAARLLDMALKDPVDTVGKRASECFAVIPPPEWREAWAACVTNPAIYIEGNDWWFIVRIGRYFGDECIAVLDTVLSTVPTARDEVLNTYAAINSERSVARLEAMFDPQDPDGAVVGALAAAHPRGHEVLRRALRRAVELQLASVIERLAPRLAWADDRDELRRTLERLLDIDEPSTIAVVFDATVHWAKEFQDIALRLARSPHPELRRRGLLRLDASGAEVRDTLLSACIDEIDKEAWANACDAFRRLCSDDDLARLRDRRRDPDPEVRWRVISALARMNEYDLLPDLREAAADPNPAVREAAIAGIRALDLTSPPPS